MASGPGGAYWQGQQNQSASSQTPWDSSNHVNGGRSRPSSSSPTTSNDQPSYLTSAHGTYVENNVKRKNSRIHPGQPLNSQVNNAHSQQNKQQTTPLNIINNQQPYTSNNTNHNNSNFGNTSNSNTNTNTTNHHQPNHSNSNLDHNYTFSDKESSLTEEDGMPEPPESFPELEDMSLNELRTLNEEKAKFDDFVSKHEYQIGIEEKIKRQRKLADESEIEYQLMVTQSMSNRKIMKGDESEVEQLQQDIEQIKERIEDLEKLKSKWLEQHSPQRLIERFNVKIRESEQTSEQLENAMLRDEMDFDDFIHQYTECRKLFHERQLKLQQLRSEQKSGAIIGA